MANPPPSPDRSPESKPMGPDISARGAILFATVFIVLTAVIFTLSFSTPVRTRTVIAPTPAHSSPTAMHHAHSFDYPATRTTEDADTLFGTKVADPYRWLENRQSPEVKSWVEEQMQFSKGYLGALPGRDALHKRYSSLLYIDTMSAPSRAGDRVFYMKHHANDEKSILYWRPATDPKAPEHVLVDPNQFIGQDNASLGDAVPSLDGKLLAYTLKPNNADEATLYVKDVATGKDLPGEVIEGAKYADPSWMPDASGFVYTYLPPADPAHPEDRPGLAEVRYHKLGTNPKNDPIIHRKTGDATKFVGASIARDGKHIFFTQQNGWDKNDLYYQQLYGQPTAKLADNWEPIVAGTDFTYSIEAWNGQGYILTNEDASHYRIFKVSLENPVRAKWKEIVPESPSIVIQGMAVIGDHLVLDELENVSSHLEIRDLNGKPVRRVKLPGLGSVSELAGQPDHPELYYGFINFTTPPEIFQTSVTNPAQTLWAKVNVPVDPSPYVVEQKFFVSKDGTKVPMFIVHRQDILLDGSTPFLIYGYGGFALSQTPFFSPGYYPWLEAGGGYALVNLRGGGEFGEQWHQDGMLLKKQNVFDDCIAAAEYLIAHGYTKPERLGIRGGSNGGLLVGAVITQRPDLFRAAVCEGPLLDMVRFNKVASGKTWVPEYGSPGDENQFKALYAYSPYHHVKADASYPSVLFCVGANDDRVDPMHAYKMTGEMQAVTGTNNPILLRVEAESGHGGGDQVKKTVDYATDIWGFLIHELGAHPPSDSPQ